MQGITPSLVPPARPRSGKGTRRVSDPFLFSPLSTWRHWRSRAQVQAGSQRRQGGALLEMPEGFGPGLGPEQGRASAGTRGSGSCLGPRIPGCLKISPNRSSLRREGPLHRTPPRLGGGCPWSSKHSSRPNWQPTAWAGPQPSQTHRGPHRRGVAAGRGRAAYCDQGHRARPGPWAGTARRPPSSPRGQDGPCPSRTRKESPAPPGPGTSSGRTLKGQTPVQPRPAEPALSGHRPSLRVSASPPPSKHVGGGAGGGAQVWLRAPAAGKGGPRSAPGFGPSSRGGAPNQSSAPPGWVT